VTLAPAPPINRAADPADDTAPPNPVAPVAAPAPLTPPKPGWMAGVWRRKWLILIAAIGLGALAYATFRYIEGTSVAVDVVERADLIETVVASGHVESPFRVDISSSFCCRPTNCKALHRRRKPPSPRPQPRSAS
jgi:hypothetical protein